MKSKSTPHLITPTPHPFSTIRFLHHSIRTIQSSNPSLSHSARHTHTHSLPVPTKFLLKIEGDKKEVRKQLHQASAMGCTASKLDNEDTVRRCKERRSLMKEAVFARHHLASAHSDYLRSLRLTGSALTRFAAGEPHTVSHHTPPILLHSPAPADSDVTHTPPPPVSIKHHKIPPESVSAASTPFYKPPVAAAAAAAAASQHRYPVPNSNYAPAPNSNYAPTPNSNYATTPTASSVWDWENFYPPSPPDSEFFERRRKELEEQQQHHLPEETGDTEIEEREEVRCSEWGGGEHSSSTCSSSTGSDAGEEEEEDDDAEPDTRSETTAARSEFDASSRSRWAPSEIGSAFTPAGKPERRAQSEAGSSSWSRRDDTISSAGDLNIVVRHRDLREIVAAIEEYFVKAADAGAAVSELLEIGRAQFERSFRQLKKTVYHSNSVLSTLSSSWSSKPPLEIRYRLDAGALEESGGVKSHGSTLERLLAWEKKLYEEVKAREGVKIEHEKKLSTLQNLEYKGRDEAKLDKTKASIQKLQSLIIVTSKAVSTTSAAITDVRDNELAQQLVEICFGLTNMWRLMNRFHEVQNQIVQQVRGLVNSLSAGESTSDLHRLATQDLESAVSSWHSSFNRLIKYQRDYIRAVYGWLKLTHFPVSSDTTQKAHSSPISVELTAFCDDWKQALDRLPDTVASEAIKSFVNVVHVISTKQTEELKIKKRAETYSKELEKKSTAMRTIEKKYYQSYSMVGLGLPDSGRDGNGQVFDTRDPLADKKSEIATYRRKVEDEMMRHAKAVEVTRSMTLSNIQTGLPGVFQAMAGFSGMFAEAMQGACRRAGSVS